MSCDFESVANGSVYEQRTYLDLDNLTICKDIERWNTPFTEPWDMDSIWEWDSWNNDSTFCYRNYDFNKQPDPSSCPWFPDIIPDTNPVKSLEEFSSSLVESPVTSVLPINRNFDSDHNNFLEIKHHLSRVSSPEFVSNDKENKEILLHLKNQNGRVLKAGLRKKSNSGCIPPKIHFVPNNEPGITVPVMVKSKDNNVMYIVRKKCSEVPEKKFMFVKTKNGNSQLIPAVGKQISGIIPIQASKAGVKVFRIKDPGKSNITKRIPLIMKPNSPLRLLVAKPPKIPAVPLAPLAAKEESSQCSGIRAMPPNVISTQSENSSNGFNMIKKTVPLINCQEMISHNMNFSSLSPLLPVRELPYQIPQNVNSSSILQSKTNRKVNSAQIEQSTMKELSQKIPSYTNSFSKGQLEHYIQKREVEEISIDEDDDVVFVSENTSESEERSYSPKALKRLLFRCQECGERLATRYSLSTHVKSHGKLCCPTCMYIANSSANMQTHINKAHSSIVHKNSHLVTSKYGRTRAVLVLPKRKKRLTQS